MSSNKNEEYLFHLLQDIYFDNIDTAKADEASEAMHNDVRWVHNQVWEHDAHKNNILKVMMVFTMHSLCLFLKIQRKMVETHLKEFMDGQDTTIHISGLIMKKIFLVYS